MTESRDTTMENADVAADGPHGCVPDSPKPTDSAAPPPRVPETVLVSGPGISQDVEKRVKKHASLLRLNFKRTAEEAWKLGGALREAKRQVRHGHWIPWVEEIGLTPRTAQRLMGLHERFSEMRHVSHFAGVSEAMRSLEPAKDATDHARNETAGSGGMPSRKKGAQTTTGGSQKAGKVGPHDDDQMPAENLTTAVTHLASILEVPPASAPNRRKSDVQALLTLADVLTGAIVRHLSSPSGAESHATGLADEFAAKLESAFGAIRNSRENSKPNVQ